MLIAEARPALYSNLQALSFAPATVTPSRRGSVRFGMFGQFRKGVAVRDTRSVTLVSFRNSEFPKVSASRVPRPQKCLAKVAYTHVEKGLL